MLYDIQYEVDLVRNEGEMVPPCFTCQIWPRAGMIGVIGLGASGGILVTSWEGQRSLKGDEIVDLI